MTVAISPYALCTLDEAKYQAGLPVSSELLLNGEFTGSAGGWTLGVDWSWAADYVSKAGGSTNTLTPDTPPSLTVGVNYRLEYTLSAWQAGAGRSVAASIGGVTHAASSADGTYTFDFVAVDTTTLVFTPTLNAAFRLDSVSLISLDQSDDDARITKLINWATFEIERICQRIFVYGKANPGAGEGALRSRTEQRTMDQIYEGAGHRSRIYVDRSPIVSVTSISDNASPANTMSPTLYTVYPALGYIEGFFYSPFDANGLVSYWNITYVAGLYETTADVDAALAGICAEAVATIFDRPDRDVIAKTIGPLSISYNKSQSQNILPLPDSVMAQLGPFRDCVLA